MEKKNALFTKKMPYDHRKKPEKLYFRLDFFNEEKNINKIKRKHRKRRRDYIENPGHPLVITSTGIRS